MRKSIYFVPAILLLSFLITDCGGGGGGGSSAPPPAPVFCTSPAGASNEMPVCYTGSEGAINIPYVTIYIDNKPFNLLLDTGATGILVNQSALQAAGINMTPNNNTFSGNFADGTTFSGFVNGAQVSTLASNGVSTDSNFPIAVNTDNSSSAAFSSSGFLQGDFGMGLSSASSFGGLSGSASFTPSIVTGLPVGSNNGFLMELSPNLSGDSFSYSGSGQLIYGLTSSNTSGFSFFPDDGAGQSFPVLDSEFGGLSKDPAGGKYKSVLDTGSNFIFMENSAIANALGMGEGSLSQVEYSLPSGTPSIGSTPLIKGGQKLSCGFYTGGGFDNNAAFTTSPNDYGVNFEFPQSVFTGVQSGGYLLIGDIITPQPNDGGMELMGLPYLFSPPAYWQANPYGIGIKIP